MKRLCRLILLIAASCFLPPASCFAQDSISTQTLNTVKWSGRTSVPSLSTTGNAICYFDKVSGKIKCSQNGGAFAELGGGGGTGTVTTVSVASANGFAGSVATPTTTPAITISTTITGLLKGDGTAISAATAGTDYVTASSTNTFTNKTQDTAGTGNSFSINGVAVTANTGTGAVVRATSPTFVTPTLGVAGATTINKVTITSPATGSTLTIPDGVTLNAGAGGTLGSNAFTSTAFVPQATTINGKALSGNITLGLASSDFANQGTTTTVLHGNAAGNPSFAVVTPADASGNTSGSGNFVLVTSPTLVTPALGAATATSINGLTLTSSTGTFTLTNGKTFSVANTLNFSGTDSSSVAFGAGGTVMYTGGSLFTLNAGSSVGLTAPGAITQGSTVTIGATTDTVRFGALGLGQAAPTAGLAITGKTISTDADGTTGAITTNSTITKNDSNTRTFQSVQIKPTFNTGASNANTTVDILQVDSTNTAVTGLTVNLLDLMYGGVSKFSVGSAGTASFGGDALPASTQSLGSATLPWLSTFTGSTTQYETVTQSAGLVTHSLAGSATNIGSVFDAKGTGNWLFFNSTASTGKSQIYIKEGAGQSTTASFQITDFGVTTTRFAVASNQISVGVLMAELSSTAWTINTGGIFAVKNIGSYNFSSGSSAGNAPDISLRRNGAANPSFDNGTAGRWAALNVGFYGAATNAIANGLTVGVRSSGTPAAGLGSGILFNVDSSTTADQNAAQIAALWVDATHATRTADTVFYNVNSAAALAEKFRVKANGNAVSQGSFVAAVAGTGLQLQSGTNARAGSATLVGATVTVSNTTVTANTIVMLTRKTSGGTIGTAITYTVSAGVSFTINSDNILDTSTFSYVLIELN